MASRRDPENRLITPAGAHLGAPRVPCLRLRKQVPNMPPGISPVHAYDAVSTAAETVGPRGSRTPGPERRLKAWVGLALLLLVAVPTGFVRGDDPKQDAPRFERDVLPILSAHCLKCHGGETRKGELDLRTLRTLLEGGKGGPILVKGKAEESELFVQVSEGTMPPDKAPKLTAEQITTIRTWIERGAPADQAEAPEPASASNADPVTPEDRQYWAFRRPARPALPAVRAFDRARTPVDAFLLARLEPKGLGFSPDAEKATLLRRVTFGLTGLPPTPEELVAFLADDAPDAYERVVDRLLNSSAYGERWGRHWLDSAGYADTVGLDNDAAIIRIRDGLWRYRDYVVAAYNADMPFDQFLREQLSGDERMDWRTAPTLDAPARDLLVATGFLRTAVDDTTENELNRPLERYQVLHGTIENFTSCVLGLTVACARCHDHKYDPIPQADYYRMMAVFMPAYNVQNWIQAHQRHLADISPTEQQAIDQANAEIERGVTERNAAVAALRAPYESALLALKLVALPEPVREPTRRALSTPAEKRHAVERYLADRYGPRLKIEPAEVDKAIGIEDRQRLTELQSQIGVLNGRRRSYGKLQALWDIGPPPQTQLLKRGNHLTPGRTVNPGVLSVLSESPADSRIEPRAQATKTSGRRSALADWLMRPGTPAAGLVARVLVNRVWQHHFGRGLVATSENVGRMGTPPTHPELLEWLADDFIASGWRIKRLHKIILTSSAYRQASHRSVDSSNPGVEPEPVDPDNVLLWHMPLHRLEAEAVRDAVLAVAGTLDRTPGGPPVPLDPRPDGRIVIDEKALPNPAAKGRRSLYLLQRRNYPLSMLGVFDVPLMNTNCPRRANSVVPLQALAMMNGAFALEQADRFAERLMREERGDASRRIERAFTLALSRPPSPHEAALSRELIDAQTARHLKAMPNASGAQASVKGLAGLCLMLFNTNEFLYVE